MSVFIQYIYISKHLSILSLSLSIIKHDLTCKLSTTYLWWTKWRTYSIIQCLPVNNTSAGNSVSKSCLSRCWGGRKKLKTMRENEKKRNNLLIINTVTEKTIDIITLRRSTWPTYEWRGLGQRRSCRRLWNNSNDDGGIGTDTRLVITPRSKSRSL